MFFSLLNSAIVIIIVLANIFLGFLVFLNNKNSLKNRYFLGESIFLAFWILSAHISEFFPLTHPTFAILFSKLALTSGSIFLYFLFLFSFAFTNKFPSKQLKIIFTIWVAIISLLTIFSPFIVKDIFVLPNGEFNILYGNLFYIFYIPYGLIIAFFIFFNLISQYKALQNKERTKFNYFFLGLGIFIVANIVTGVLLPLITGLDTYYRLGNYSSIFFVGFTAYAIVAKQLLGIKVILTDFLVGIMGILLLILPLLMPTPGLKLFTAILFLLFCFFGYLLIRYTHQEIKRQEELKQLSEQLQVSNIRLEAALQELRQSYDELKQLDDAKTMFLSIASHQLRTPLSAMKGYLSMVLSGEYGTKVEGKIKEFLLNVYRSNEKEIDLVNDILDISRLQTGKMQFSFQPVQVEEIIEDVIKQFQEEVKQKNISLEFQRPKEALPKVKLDPTKFRQVILNLIDNALKYTQKGKIIVSLHQKSPNSVLLAVKDTGMGLTKEDKESLFHLFVRSNEAVNTHPSGVGIGLYFAKEIVKAHNGKIWAESEGKNKGSTFYIEIPVK